LTQSKGSFRCFLTETTWQINKQTVKAETRHKCNREKMFSFRAFAQNRYCKLDTTLQKSSVLFVKSKVENHLDKYVWMRCYN